MRDHHIGDEFGQGLDGGLFIFIDIDDQMSGREPPDLLDVDRLGPAHLRHLGQGLARMHTEAGTAHQPVAAPQRTHQLGKARDQRNDPWRAHEESPAIRALRGARAKSAS